MLSESPTLRSPADLRRLPREQLGQLCAEIRDTLIDVTATNGGHLGPNLGVVELTVALHLVFATAKDQDVYQTHPEHLKFVEECKGLWKQVRVFDSRLE